MKKTLAIALIASLGHWALPAHSTPAETHDAAPVFPPAQRLYNKDGAYSHLTGIGRFKSNMQCTASLIDTRHRHEILDQPAYVLTSGHCVDSGQGKILTNTPITGHVEFNYFADTTDSTRQYALKQVHWSSMRGIDLAIVELDASLGDLMQAGIQPLLIAAPLKPGSDIVIVGAPQGEHLQLSSCRLESLRDIIEHPWIWPDSLKTRCRGLGQGSSGSPILDPRSNTLVGVVNTLNKASTSHAKCHRNAPCEISDNALHWQGNVVYGPSTKRLLGCFVQGRLDLSPRQCRLFPTYAIDAPSPRLQQNYLGARPELDLKALSPTWNLKFSASTAFYRYKVDSRQSCASAAGYSMAMSTANAHINGPIGTDPGLHWLCLVGVESPEQKPTWGLLENALIVATELRDQQNQAPELVMLQGWGAAAGYRSAMVLFEPPAHERIFIKTGVLEHPDCDDPKDYEEIFPRSNHYGFVAENDQAGEKKICLYSQNIRGEPSKTASHFLKSRNESKGKDKDQDRLDKP
ncbi:trypsin-like peptidase domain-containing protein [Pseudomonas gingeri]|uniref:trypsin-like serine peptidase n=1 Tax=Pseudomonas gingeri TaxID=117681 RepID=UPI0015A181CA|nr:serine protease [Pseudomonas gingeri]NWA28266.1 trypsin-like peptidase domain-containing protein [Pseudomonas gingeri]